MDKETSREDFKKLNMEALVKKTVKLLAENHDVLEINFMTRSGSLALALAEIRNSRGDISHGKPVPKPEKSSEILSSSVYQITEGIVIYMIKSFFRISEELKIKESGQPDSDNDFDLEQVKYEDNEDFNNLLDADMPWDDKLLYSKALYELYYEDYLIRLNDYRDSNEEI